MESVPSSRQVHGVWLHLLDYVLLVQFFCIELKLMMLLTHADAASPDLYSLAPKLQASGLPGAIFPSADTDSLALTVHDPSCSGVFDLDGAWLLHMPASSRFPSRSRFPLPAGLSANGWMLPGILDHHSFSGPQSRAGQ